MDSVDIEKIAEENTTPKSVNKTKLAKEQKNAVKGTLKLARKIKQRWVVDLEATVLTITANKCYNLC